MAKEKNSANIKELFYGVRLSLTLTIIVLVACSLLVMAVVIVSTSRNVQLTPTQLSRAIEESSEQTQQEVKTPAGKQAIEEVSAGLFEQFSQERVQRIYQLTPLIIAASALIAYLVARRLLRPISDSYNAQERFLQDAAHELRNPLAALKVTVQNIKGKDTISQEDAEQLLKSTETQVNRLISINEDLLYLERRSSKKDQQAKSNVSELLCDVLEDLQSLANKKGLTIISTIQEDIYKRIPADSFVKLSRNIIENAIKYSTDQSEEVRVNLSSKNGRLRLSVRDFGIGIPSADLAQIGRRFYRGSNTSLFHGTGLGMAIVQKVVSQFDGTVTVNSREGEGTHVVVNL